MKHQRDFPKNWSDNNELAEYRFYGELTLCPSCCNENGAVRVFSKALIPDPQNGDNFGRSWGYNEPKE